MIDFSPDVKDEKLIDAFCDTPEESGPITETWGAIPSTEHGWRDASTTAHVEPGAHIKIEGLFAHAHNMADKLPDDHPYKSEPPKALSGTPILKKLATDAIVEEMLDKVKYGIAEVIKETLGDGSR